MSMEFGIQTGVSSQVKNRLFGIVGTKHVFPVVENLGLILGLHPYQLYVRGKRTVAPSVNQSNNASKWRHNTSR